MRKTFFKIMLILAICSASAAFAQEIKIPQPSSSQTITQDFGLGKIILNYSRPNVKGRKIFGALEPYGKVWRTGANAATTIKFTDEVTIMGKKIPAGEYGLFSIPDPKEWTIIINKTAKQWGAYEYKEADDLARFKIKPTTLDKPVETFTMQFANVKSNTCELHIRWENTSLVIPMETDVDSQVMAGIDLAMESSDRKPYFAAAVYYYENNKDLKKALEWITAAEKTDAKAPWLKLWKARIQLKMGNKSAALATAIEGVKLAEQAKNDEYIRLNKEVMAQAKS